MQKEDIQLQQIIVHIMDSSTGIPVLSDQLLDWGSDFGDFLRTHIFRLLESDDARDCVFEEDSVVGELIRDLNQENFVEITGKIGEHLYGIMNRNINIPPADLVIARCRLEQKDYLALLKMNYRSSYTHMTDSDPWGNTNSIIKQKAILPGENQKLSEAALIRLEDGAIRLVEKKYEINGVKANYFSQMFLACRGPMSARSQLAVVTRAVEDVQKKYYNESEQFEVQMETKSIISQALEEGPVEIPSLVDKIFKEQEEMKEEVVRKLDKYHLTDSCMEPVNPATTRKFGKQNLVTDTGIEIRIPMDQYQNKNRVEFLTNPDGTISVLIKNVGSITSR